MGLTQHRSGVLAIQMLSNLLLMRGNIGKPGAGIFPVRGHSNVQGQRTVGITEKPELVPLDRLAEQYGFDPPRERGLDTVGACEAVRDGSVKAFIALGGNFIRAIPETDIMERAWRQLQITVQIVTKLNRGALIHGKTAYLATLPRPHRNRPSGVRRAVRYGRGYHGPLSCFARPGRAGGRTPLVGAEDRRRAGEGDPCRPTPSSTGTPGAAITHSCAMPSRRPIQTSLRTSTSASRIPHGFDRPLPARERRWTTPNGKANFISPRSLSEDPDLPRMRVGVLTLITVRSNDQFNTTVYGYDDRLRGIDGTRMVVLMNKADMEEHGLGDGDEVDLLGAAGDTSPASCAAYASSPTTCRGAHVPATIPSAIRCFRYGTTPKAATCRQRNPSQCALAGAPDAKACLRIQFGKSDDVRCTSASPLTPDDFVRLSNFRDGPRGDMRLIPAYHRPMGAGPIPGLMLPPCVPSRLESGRWGSYRYSWVSLRMVDALLPVYLVTVLGTSTLTVGIIEGIAEATASVTKVFSGALSDWLGKRKLLAAIGQAHLPPGDWSGMAYCCTLHRQDRQGHPRGTARRPNC